MEYFNKEAVKQCFAASFLHYVQKGGRKFDMWERKNLLSAIKK